MRRLMFSFLLALATPALAVDYQCSHYSGA
jgi:hypothetical protein